MNDCNATLTLLFRTDEVVVDLDDFLESIGNAVWQIPDGVTVTRDGDRLLRADVTVLTCERTDDHHSHYVGKPGPSSFVCWTDDTEGATPHACSHPTVVGDGQGNEWCHDCNTPGATPHVGMSETNRHAADVERCTICGGSGASKDGDCPRCESTGREPDPCPDCEGLTRWLHDEDGNVITTVAGVPCPSCGGSGSAPTVTGRWEPEEDEGEWRPTYYDGSLALPLPLVFATETACADWIDDHLARSGTAPPFTDAEREAAMEALSRYQPDWNSRRIATEVLQAAAHARQENP